MGDYVETLEYAKIIADKIKESSRFFNQKYAVLNILLSF